MRNLSLLFIAILILQFTSLAQEGWFWQNPLPQGNTFNDVWVFDENNAIAVGSYGTIFKTTDSGITWNELLRITNKDLISLHFVDENIGWAVGVANTVLKTTNSGNDWTIVSQDSNDCARYSSVCFADENTGWVNETNCEGKKDNLMGSRILKTTDGGTTWELQGFFGTFNEMYTICFIDSNYGWAVGLGDSTYRTTNGGENWFGTFLDSYNFLNSVFFIDSNIGWAVGADGIILKTTDGAQTWTSQTSGTTKWLRSVYFINQSTGWAAGSGTILKTTDGGTTWLEEIIDPTYRLTAISFSNTNYGFAVGEYGVTLKTSNGGSNWTAQSSSITYHHLNSIFMLDENIGWVAGSGGTIIKTLDGGSNWSANTLTDNISIKDISFSDNENGWAIGYDYDNECDVILNTSDGGNNWVQQFADSSDQTFNSLYFHNNQLGWVVGFNGLILKTTNGGINWESKLSGISLDLSSVCFGSVLDGCAVGKSGIILKTNDGGESWHLVNSNTSSSLNDICFIDTYTAYIVGAYVILKTTNSGSSWTDISMVLPPFNSFDPKSVHFISWNVGWIVGTLYNWIDYSYNESVVFATIDGGSNWVEQPINTNNSCNSIFFVNSTTGWLVGNGGTILKTTTGGVSFVEETQIDAILTDYNLSNNFPNPFNPSTKIKYSIPQTSNVVIKIYDVLGNEIETLINEEKPVGTYELTWYAENLPSGIYFYQLRAGSFVETKKMVLMK